MRLKIKYGVIPFVCIMMVLVVIKSYNNAAERQVISDAEVARAMWACQNLMSRHNYYHATGKHMEELEKIWVKKDGPYGKTATWTNPSTITTGMDTIYNSYGKGGSKVAVKGCWSVHLNTTPIIEIAGDGKTAKGVWYSPGVGVGFRGKTDEDGNPAADGMWFWEKYGVDFVKEDGKWKIWHIQMYYDHTPGISAETGSTIWTTPSSGGGPTADLPDGVVVNPNPYKMWGPDSMPVLRPELPEPYYTFSETFSY